MNEIAEKHLKNLMYAVEVKGKYLTMPQYNEVCRELGLDDSPDPADAMVHTSGIDSWPHAYQLIGYDIAELKKATLDKLFNEALHCAASLLPPPPDGKHPVLTRTDYERIIIAHPWTPSGEKCPIPSTIMNNCGHCTWEEALIRYHLEDYVEVKISNEDLLADLRKCKDALHKDQIVKKDYITWPDHKYPYTMIETRLKNKKNAEFIADAEKLGLHTKQAFVLKVTAETDMDELRKSILQNLKDCRDAFDGILFQHLYMRWPGRKYSLNQIHRYYPGGWEQAVKDIGPGSAAPAKSAAPKRSATLTKEEAIAILNDFREDCVARNINPQTAYQRVFQNYLETQGIRFSSKQVIRALCSDEKWTEVRREYLGGKASIPSAPFDLQQLVHELISEFLEKGIWPTVELYQEKYEEGGLSINVDVIYKHKYKWDDVISAVEQECRKTPENLALFLRNRRVSMEERILSVFGKIMQATGLHWFDHKEFEAIMTSPPEGLILSEDEKSLTVSQVRSKFKSWEKVFFEFGITKDEIDSIIAEKEKRQCVDDYKFAVTVSGEILTLEGYQLFKADLRKTNPDRKLSGYDLIKNRWGSFSAMRAQALLELNITPVVLTREDFIQDMQKIAEALGTNKFSKKHYLKMTRLKFPVRQLDEFGFQNLMLEARHGLMAHIKLEYRGNRKIIFEFEIFYRELITITNGFETKPTVENYKFWFQSGLVTYSYPTLNKNGGWKELLEKVRLQFLGEKVEKTEGDTTAVVDDIERVREVTLEENTSFQNYQKHGRYEVTEKEFNDLAKNPKNPLQPSPDRNQPWFSVAGELSRMLTEPEPTVAKPLRRKAKGGSTASRKKSDGSAKVRSPNSGMFSLLRSGGRCECCGALRVPGANGMPLLHIHHNTPLAEGGIDSEKNEVCLCPNCHNDVHYANPAFRQKVQGRIDKIMSYHEAVTTKILMGIFPEIVAIMKKPDILPQERAAEILALVRAEMPDVSSLIDEELETVA